MKKRIFLIAGCLLAAILLISGCKKQQAIVDETGSEISVDGLFDTSTPNDNTAATDGDDTGLDDTAGSTTVPDNSSTSTSGSTDTQGDNNSSGDKTTSSGGGTSTGDKTTSSSGDESKPVDDSSDEKTGTVVKIITQNLLYDGGEGDYPDWKKAANRKNYIRDLLIPHDADSMGFQETTNNWKGYLSEQFPEYQQVGVMRFGDNNEANLSGSNEGDIILIKSDRLKLIEGKTWWLSDTPEVVGSKTWGGSYPCTLTLAYVEIKETGERYAHFSTHLSHDSTVANDKGAAKTVELIEDYIADKGDLAVYATADWNFDDSSNGYATLNSYLNDSRQVSITGDMWLGTFPAKYYYDDNGPDSTIDFIFVNDFVAVDEYTLLDDTVVNGQYAFSDHYGICITSRIYS